MKKMEKEVIPMKLLFDPDGPVVQALSILADLILLNLCFLLCCGPLITIGPSVSALYGVFLRRREGEGVVKLFFTCFRKSFRQAAIVWLLLAGAGAVLIADFRLLDALENPPAAVPLLLYLAGLFLAGAGCYVFPMIAVYRDTIPRMLKNALILSVTALPKTLVVTLLSALPLIVLAADAELFGRLLMLWLLVGFSVTAKINSHILRGVFQKLVNTDEPQ